MPMNPRILRPLARPLLLDAVPGAAAAYSLRQLSNSYTGPVVTVRRSSDDAEEDFRASEIDDGTLAAFCGAGDGFVKTWFDQSGNTGRDASQGTAAAQPKIVSTGVVILEEAKPAIQFDGSDDFFSFGPVSSLDPWTIAEVKRRPTAGTSGPVVGSAASPTVYAYWQYTDDIAYARNREGNFLCGPASNDQIISFVINPTSLKADMSVFRNGVALPKVSGGGSVSTADLAYIGRVASFYGTGVYQELIIYPSDQSANRERIEGDLAWYY